MRNVVQCPSANPAHSVVTSSKTICVVDPQASAEAGSRDEIAAHGARLEFVASAEAALRLAHTQQVDLWVVNTELAGLSGFELCSMLKARNSRAAVCLVANEYSTIAEQRAWAARASMFLCKSDSTDWLEELCGQLADRWSPGFSLQAPE
jgi:DNA-binding response OmpR family regulator